MAIETRRVNPGLIEVFNEGEHGYFFHHSADRAEDGRPGYCVLSAETSFGRYGHEWVNLGPDWRLGLASMGKDYLLGKLAHGWNQKPDYNDTIRRIHKLIPINARKGEAWEDFVELREQLKEGNYSPETSVEMLIAKAYDLDFITTDDMVDRSCNGRKVDPQVDGFWNKLWLPFIDHLRHEIEQKAELDQRASAPAPDQEAGPETTM